MVPFEVCKFIMPREYTFLTIHEVSMEDDSQCHEFHWETVLSLLCSDLWEAENILFMCSAWSIVTSLSVTSNVCTICLGQNTLIFVLCFRSLARIFQAASACVTKYVVLWITVLCLCSCVYGRDGRSELFSFLCPLPQMFAASSWVAEYTEFLSVTCHHLQQRYNWERHELFL